MRIFKNLIGCFDVIVNTIKIMLFDPGGFLL